MIELGKCGDSSGLFDTVRNIDKMKTALDEPLGFFCFVLLRNLVQMVGIVRVAALYSSEKHHSLLHHPCEECSLECTTYCSLLLCEGLLTLSL